MYLQGGGRTRVLDEVTGIDLLGDMVESTQLSVNRTYYGNLHGFGHDLISFIHDPDGRYLEDFSVMGHVATAMRDPGEHLKFLALHYSSLNFLSPLISFLSLALIHQYRFCAS